MKQSAAISLKKPDATRMKKSAAAWSLVGIVAGIAGLATSYLVAQWMNLRLDPVIAVAERVRDILPDNVVNWGRENDGKSLTVPGILIILTLVFALLGFLGRRAWWIPVAGFGAVAVIGGIAVMQSNGATVSWLLPVAVGYATMTATFSLVAERLRRLQDLPDDQLYSDIWSGRRRDFMIAVAAVVGAAGVSALVARVLGRDVRAVDQERRLSRLPVSAPILPAAAKIGVEGVSPWMTPAENFYLIDTAFSKPAIRAKDWRLRIHGMVENEIELSYEDLVNRDVIEAWVTLNCVSNPVGGELVGNAWWSGVKLSTILAEAKPLDGATAVLQTSDDGWNCATPIEALTDDRNAMLAVAMNGEPLPIEHGYPVRTIVPGLYGYVSATKWVVDMEVTTFEDVDAYWTQRGWGEFGPVKMASRIEVPSQGDDLAAGDVVIAGTAWSQHTGISGVEVAVDGQGWVPAELGESVTIDSWVQWRAVVSVTAGNHIVGVRAIDNNGLVQTSAIADVLPDGATGLHAVEFSASA